MKCMIALLHLGTLLLLLLISILWQVPDVEAALGCQDCHGTRTPADYRPVDAPARDPFTGGFQGNHRTHIGATTSAGVCNKCHPDSSKYAIDHRDSKIKLSANINASPLQSLYKNSSTAFSQTATPTLGSCTNVNCHFEKISPQWGDANFLQQPNDCLGTCHNSPPNGGAGGSDGGHSDHETYFPGLINCSKCHPDHTVQPLFAHATSAANRGIAFNRTNPYFGPYGRYSGNVKDFLPSQNNSFGRCLTVYCHSSAQGLISPTDPPVTLYAPVWGESFTDSICGGTKGCHGVGFAHPEDASVPGFQARWKALESGSHSKHIKYRFNQSGNCQVCHYNFTNTGGAGCSSCHLIHGSFRNHIDRNIAINFNPENILFSDGTGAYSGDSVPGTPYGSCSGFYCHSDGTAVSSGELPMSPAIQWGVDALSCSGCHGYPPAYSNGSLKANSHTAHNGFSCSACHYNTTSNGTGITTDRYHVNREYNVNAESGVSFVYSYASLGGSCNSISCHHGGNATWGTTLPCNGCHDAPPTTASHMIHYSGTVAQAGYGDTRIAQDFTPTSTGYIMNCGNCHPMDASRHGNGNIEVELYNAQSPVGSLKALNPSSAAYANGTTLHIDSRGFTYTSGSCSNVYCHSYTEWTTPGGVPLQSDCFPSSGSYWPPNLIITRNYNSVRWGGPHLDCAGCHANPPKTSYPSNDGGAGNSHSWINNYGEEDLHGFNHGFRAITCNYCHNETVTQDSTWTRDYYGVTTFSNVPIENFSKHINGSNNVSFKSVFIYYSTGISKIRKTMDLTSATYDASTKNCNNVSCHFNQTSVKWGTPYRYFDYRYECDRCHRYGYGGCQ